MGPNEALNKGESQIIQSLIIYPDCNFNEERIFIRQISWNWVQKDLGGVGVGGEIWERVGSKIPQLCHVFVLKYKNGWCKSNALWGLNTWKRRSWMTLKTPFLNFHALSSWPSKQVQLYGPALHSQSPFSPPWAVPMCLMPMPMYMLCLSLCVCVCICACVWLYVSPQLYSPKEVGLTDRQTHWVSDWGREWEKAWRKAYSIAMCVPCCGFKFGLLIASSLLPTYLDASTGSSSFVAYNLLILLVMDIEKLKWFH